MRELFVPKNFTEASRALLDIANDVLADYQNQGYDLSLRQLYYQLVSRDRIENSLKSYKRLGNLINDARLAGQVDWAMIVDRNRITQHNSHWESPADILDAAAYSFQLDKWENQPYHIEVMVEKDALSGVLQPVCSDLDIRFTANKGYPSSSILYRLGQRLYNAIVIDHKTPIILHLGDHDPSGIDMTRDLVDRLTMFTREPVKIDRLALNMIQVKRYDPPPNPAKVSDSRYKGYVLDFGKSSWELDALEPSVLAELVTKEVQKYIDQDAWDETLFTEKTMRDRLKEMAEEFRAEN